jgi:hypothetical protein
MSSQPVRSGHRHEPVDVCHGNGLEQQPIDEAEQRRVGPNPKRQCQNGNRGKSGRAPEAPPRIRKIVRELVHRESPVAV